MKYATDRPLPRPTAPYGGPYAADATLRDLIAMRALSGLLAYPNTRIDIEKVQEYAHLAYKLADAMLEERVKP